MDTIFVKPTNAAVKVPNPDNGDKPLSLEGETVMASRYWQKRAKDGDVTISAPPAPKSKSKKKD